MTVYEQELRKLFEHSNLVDRPQFSGRVCVGDLGKDLHMHIQAKLLFPQLQGKGIFSECVQSGKQILLWREHHIQR